MNLRASDCDVLTVPGCDVRLVVYTVAAGSADAEKLEFLRVTNGVPADGSSLAIRRASKGQTSPTTRVITE